MPKLQVSAFALLVVALAACASRHQAAWGETDPEPAPTETAKPSGSANADAVCEAPSFLGVKLGKQRELPPWSSVQGVHLVQDQPAGGPQLREDDLEEIVSSGAPLDSCDPSIAPWQYAPGTSGSLRLRTGENVRFQLYLGSRGALIWPDGTGVLFDYGPAAPWLPKELQPYAKREWKRDRECSLAKVQPHFISFQPGEKGDAKSTEALARMCQHPAKAAPPSEWCCP